MNSLAPAVSHSLDFAQFARRSLCGEVLSRDEARALLNAPPEALPSLLEATLEVREYYFERRVKLCVLLNAQSGICPEDCGYCSQSKISTAPVAKYKLMPPAQIVESAQRAVDAGARRFCMVIAARGPQQRDIDHLSDAITQIKADPTTSHLEICTSLGLMNLEQCQQLKSAGVDYVNHNLNTSESHYAKICSTHTYADRVQTLHNVQSAGLKTCSGGIIGMGETLEDVLDLAFTTRAMNIESIPVNFLLSIEGTPLGNSLGADADFGLKVLCLMRLLNPDKEVRASAGREKLGARQVLALYAANSIFVDGYLTTPGESHDEVKQWIEAAGFEIEA